MGAPPTEPAPGGFEPAYKVLSGGQRLRILLLAVATAVGVVMLLLHPPGGVKRRPPPPPADAARCQGMVTQNCVGGTVGVLAPAAAASR